MFFGVLVVYGPAVRVGGWHGDEPHKIAETYFLRLALAGRFRDRAWFADKIARANPQFGKAVFGLAILAGGDELPRDLSIQQELLASPDFRTTETTRLANVSRLVSVRRVSLVATGVAAAALLWVISRTSGLAGGLIAGCAFCRHYVVSAQATTAVYDALITATIVLTLVAALGCARGPRWARATAVVATGLLCAIAFQTRLSGLTAWLAAMTLIAVLLSLRKRWSRLCKTTLALTAVMVATSVAMNPYYTFTGGNIADSVPLVIRPIVRFGVQVRDLATLLHGHSAELKGWGERLLFEAAVLASGIAGKVLLAGVVSAVLLLAFRSGRAGMSDASRALVLASLAVAGALLVWLPVRWDRYLEPAIASFAVCTGAAANVALSSLRRSRRQGWTRGATVRDEDGESAVGARDR